MFDTFDKSNSPKTAGASVDLISASFQLRRLHPPCWLIIFSTPNSNHISNSFKHYNLTPLAVQSGFGVELNVLFNYVEEEIIVLLKLLFIAILCVGENVFNVSGNNEAAEANEGIE